MGVVCLSYSYPSVVDHLNTQQHLLQSGSSQRFTVYENQQSEYLLVYCQKYLFEDVMFGFRRLFHVLRKSQVTDLVVFYCSEELFRNHIFG